MADTNQSSSKKALSILDELIQDFMICTISTPSEHKTTNEISNEQCNPSDNGKDLIMTDMDTNSVCIDYPAAHYDKVAQHKGDIQNKLEMFVQETNKKLPIEEENDQFDKTSNNWKVKQTQDLILSTSDTAIEASDSDDVSSSCSFHSEDIMNKITRIEHTANVQGIKLNAESFHDNLACLNVLSSMTMDQNNDNDHFECKLQSIQTQNHIQIETDNIQDSDVNSEPSDIEIIIYALSGLIFAVAVVVETISLVRG
eukprot:159706_1